MWNGGVSHRRMTSLARLLTHRSLSSTCPSLVSRLSKIILGGPVHLLGNSPDPLSEEPLDVPWHPWGRKSGKIGPNQVFVYAFLESDFSRVLDSERSERTL